MNMEVRTPRDLALAVKRGFRSRCPNCGNGHLFRKFLKVADHCEVCGEDYTHQRADDAPAYFVMLIVGHIVVPLMLLVETELSPPYWVHAVIWAPVTLLLAFGLIQPIKGAIVGWQWAQQMHGFQPDGKDHSDPKLA